ncbi:Small subunit (SSU) processome component [Claviceps sp. Clav32 group G5]|nr:Small subunit (SSU) processome component [Claviceps sp. Clav32 group G5]KAG6049228.1 Small subunit (SSU) processome component [Claviceps sp. Clav50 group G5]
MSSMRNAVARRPHRERAQPLERRRLGLLEKHKDYTLRAKDFGKKKAQLKSLRQKAADRNEDEFYFGMMSRKGPGSRIQNGKRWDGTVEGDRGNKALSVETVRLLKTQDIGYIRTMRQVLVKEIARLEQQVVLTRGLDRLDDDDDDDEDGADDEDNNLSDDDMPMPSRPKAARKIVFLDDEEERQGAMLERLEAEQEDHEEEKNNAPGGDKDQEEDDEEFERAKNLRRLKRQLANAKMKVQAFNDAEAALDVQRAKMAKTATSGGQSRRGKKLFVRARKR